MLDLGFHILYIFSGKFVVHICPFIAAIT